jgi:hypothetical protein
MKIIYAVVAALSCFSTAQAVQYNPANIVYINGRATLLGPCQSVGNGGVIINERCLPSTVGRPDLRDPAWGVVNQPFDQRAYQKELAVAALLKKANDAKDLAMTNAMIRMMQNIGRRAAPAYAPQPTGGTQPQESSSGGTTQTNTLCRIFNERSCVPNGCRWDRVRSRCS